MEKKERPTDNKGQLWPDRKKVLVDYASAVGLRDGQKHPERSL
jgi:hypothetical protein